ncbi:MAG TPA: glutamate--tRNA ligase [Candidatus Micrarchaeia archaeon]|nr:glutamate--tRNA ligase [Candidatus Micrarchaeia archaeon]
MSPALGLDPPAGLPGDRRLRFAPSPTGPLHIGNVRTALFSYCLAGPGGRFLLRIEDTDRNRLDPTSLASILESLRWLGLLWDEGPEVGGPCAPYVESERLPLYRVAADRLLGSGAAYRCFCTAERLEGLRTAQRAAGQPTRYDNRCRAVPAAEATARASAGEPHVVRLRVPDGETAWDDLVQGSRRIDNHAVDDQVLLKSDGFPTYHLGHVVDDHQMGMTWVIRADEWLPSTPKHLLLYQALGWRPPAFGHVSRVLAPDGTKLSKRHGAASVLEYRDLGYLPEALVNFLAFQGWSPGNEEEVFSLAELRERMTVERLQASPSIFDRQRLDHLNGVWIRRLDVATLADRLAPWLPAATAEQRHAIAAMVQERIKRLDEVPALVAFAFREPEPDADQIRGRLDRAEALWMLDEATRALDADPADFMDRLRTAAGTPEPGTTEPASKQRVRDRMHVVRVALTGEPISPPLPDSVALVGTELARARLGRARAALAARPG